MTVDEFAVLASAFVDATKREQRNQSEEFIGEFLDREELDWCQELTAYIIYTDMQGEEAT